jgi:DNA-binding transcriptional regulator YbjK
MSERSTRLTLVQRRQHARATAMELLDAGMTADEMTLRKIASHAGWPLASLHHAYSTVGSLLTDCLVEIERSLSNDLNDCADDRGLREELYAMLSMQVDNYICVPAREQMLRYQFALAAKGQQARVELSGGLWAPRGDEAILRWLTRVQQAAAETYALSPSTLVKAIEYGRNGAFLGYFNRGDVAQLRADLDAFADMIANAAQPTKQAPNDR